jgi:hypothetical protein
MLSTAYPFSEVDLFCDVEALTSNTSGADIAQTCAVQPKSLLPLGTVITPESDQLRVDVEGFSELEFQYGAYVLYDILCSRSYLTITRFLTAKCRQMLCVRRARCYRDASAFASLCDCGCLTRRGMCRLGERRA